MGAVGAVQLPPMKLDSVFCTHNKLEQNPFTAFTIDSFYYSFT